MACHCATWETLGFATAEKVCSSKECALRGLVKWVDCAKRAKVADGHFGCARTRVHAGLKLEVSPSTRSSGAQGGAVSVWVYRSGSGK